MKTNAVTNVTNAVINAVTNVTNAVINAVINVTNAVTNAVPNVTNAVPNVVPNVTNAVPNVTNAVTNETDSMRVALEFADRGCSCESYYNYRCSRCREIVEVGFPIGLKKAVDIGLVTWGGYGSPRLTEAGYKLLEHLRRGE